MMLGDESFDVKDKRWKVLVGVEALKKNRKDFGKGFDFVWVRFLFNDDFDKKQQEGLLENSK